MRWTIFGLIVVGIVAALSAVLLAATIKASYEKKWGDGGAPSEVEILVTTQQLPAMSVVHADMVATKRVGLDEAPPGAMRNAVQVIGHVLISPLVEGQVFRSSHFADDDSNVHLSSALGEGFRAMSIMLPPDSGIESLLYPGGIVDVVASFRIPSISGKPSGEIVSATLLEGVQVLAVGSRSIVSGQSAENLDDAKGRRGRMVTLMVNPDQAEALQLAMTYGELRLAMRNPLDKTVAGSGGVLMSDLSEEIAKRIAAVAEIDSVQQPMLFPTAQMTPGTAAVGAEATAPGAATTTVAAATTDGAEPVFNLETVEQVDMTKYWETVVLRGPREDKKLFPLPLVDEQQGNE